MYIHSERNMELRTQGFGKGYGVGKVDVEESSKRQMLIGQIKSMKPNLYTELQDQKQHVSGCIAMLEKVTIPGAIIGTSEEWRIFSACERSSFPENEEEGYLKFQTVLADQPGMPYSELKKNVTRWRAQVEEALANDPRLKELKVEEAALEKKVDSAFFTCIKKHIKQAYPGVVDEYLKTYLVSNKFWERFLHVGEDLSVIFAQCVNDDKKFDAAQFEKKMDSCTLLHAIDQYLDVMHDQPLQGAARNKAIAGALKDLCYDDEMITFVTDYRQHRDAGTQATFLQEQFGLHKPEEPKQWRFESMEPEAYHNWCGERVLSAGHSQGAADMVKKLIGAFQKKGIVGAEEFLEALAPKQRARRSHPRINGTATAEATARLV